MVDSITYTFNQAVTLAANAFTVSIHGTSAIAAATESGTTVTITTSANHNFFTGQVITVAGVGVAGYNGTFTITVVDATTFTYTASTSGLANASGGTAGPGTVPTASYASPDGGFTWVVTFSGTGVIGNSIADGVYDITLNQSAVTYNYSGATLTQSNRTLDTFYRLYGDFNGARRVNNASLLKFNTALNSRSTQANFLVYFDFNDDGRINNADLLALNQRLNKSYAGLGFTATI
jgi:hypothetical protein